MEKYSSGKLTKRTDRLIALSGIAHKMHSLVFPHDTYLAGLWKHDLPFGLLWDVKDPQVSDVRQEYIAPSWSWAARVGTVPCEQETWGSASILVDIVNATVEPINNSHHTGQIRDGHIQLSGVLARGILFPVYQPGDKHPGVGLKINDRRVYGVFCRLDNGFNSTVRLPDVVYCLPILSSKRHTTARYKGLLLVPSGREKEFRRYGTFIVDSVGNEPLVTPCTPSAFETGYIHPNGQYQITIV
jgi:hypothetical protein